MASINSGAEPDDPVPGSAVRVNNNLRLGAAAILALLAFVAGGVGFYILVRDRITAHALAMPGGALQANMGEWMAALFGGGALAVLVFLLVMGVGRRRG
jgi:hypothetical protein